MVKNVLLVVGLLAGLALALGASALPAAAAGPGNTFPGGATAINNQTQSIPANAALWYSFQYAGDRSTITATLVNGNGSGIQFNVFTPAQIGDWWETPPIGRGTVQMLDCSTMTPSEMGQCQSNDLIWIGDFNASGTYYIEVVNTTGSSLNFTLTIQGTSVTLGPQTTASQPGPAQPAAPAQTNQPGASATTATGPATNTWPGAPAMMDNQPHAVPANGSLWYSFQYVSKGSQINITLTNGNGSGLGFNVFTASQIGDWWNEKPIGRGTAQALNCDTGLPATDGSCQASDLTWSGNFNMTGTYYVQLTNSNSMPTTANLTIQGTGVSLSR